MKTSFNFLTSENAYERSHGLYAGEYSRTELHQFLKWLVANGYAFTVDVEHLRGETKSVIVSVGGMDPEEAGDFAKFH